MAGLANPYFNKQPVNEQTLLQGIVTEAIQVSGFNAFYLPRQTQNLDLVLGEDVVSKFDKHIEIEIYQDSFSGFQGQQEMISKFGLEIRNQIVFQISVTRWAVEKDAIASVMLNGGDRPQEGDLIYDPITKRLYNIVYIDFDWQFVQLGKMTYSYKITTEQYQFANAVGTTGITELDDAINLVNTNQYDFELMQESGFRLLQEDGSSIFQEHSNASPLQYDSSAALNIAVGPIKFNDNDPFNSLL